MKKYKVVQWATGGMGKNCLRAVIDHPALEAACRKGATSLLGIVTRPLATPFNSGFAHPLPD